MKKLLITFMIQNFIFNICIADEAAKLGASAFRDYALPSEFESVKKEGGSIFYSASSKGKVLIPVNIWGEVNKTGLHFVPVDTDVVQGLSLAGGPKSTAALDKIKLTKNINGKIEEFKFNLEKGGTIEAYQQKLGPGDTIFVEKEYFYENRTYYTTLIGVVATLLSSFIIYKKIK